MGVYDRQIASAKRVIKKKGQLCTWIKRDVVTSVTQPWKTTPAVDTVPTFPVSIVFLAPKQKLSHELFHLMSGTDIPEGGPYGLMAAVSFTPEINDSVLSGTETLVVKSLDIVAPNRVEPILYKVQFA